MPANKMPEMPEAVAWADPADLLEHRHGLMGTADETQQPGTRYTEALYTADQMRAMWLAGLEAAKACVPDTDPFSGGADRDKDSQVTGQIHFRHAVLTNLTALEQEAKK